jgi:hypothetical protein
MNESNTPQLCDGENGNNICIECGLCCDGSMFMHVKIDKSDDPTLLKQLGVESVEVRDKPFFLQPCIWQEGKLCRLYNDKRRFKVCKAFKCRLLRQYLSGEISYPSALAVIREILIRRQSVKAFSEILYPDDNKREPSIFSFIRELNLSGKMKDPAFRRIYSKQILDCFIFRELLNRSFYKKNGKTPELDEK